MLRRFITLALGLTLGIAGVVGLASPAKATAQTCISAPLGYVCTIVYGSGQHVDSIGVSRGKAPTAICNYSVWFFIVEPGTGVHGLATQYRSGCVFGRAWFNQALGWSFAHGTQMCAKFYEDGWSSFIGEKCVGIS